MIMLCGPIVRRATPQEVCIWFATRRNSTFEIEVRPAYFIQTARPTYGAVIGQGRAVSYRLATDRGPNSGLVVHLARVRPLAGNFPTEAPLAYDVIDRGWVRGTPGIGRLEGADPEICYGRLTLPTFILQNPAYRLRALHGSCRKLHAGGPDGMEFLERQFEAQIFNQRESVRPHALFLTGDQIYADDVGALLIAHLGIKGIELTGRDELVPRVYTSVLHSVGGRQAACRAAGFSSTAAANHLMTFGEFCAMYLVSWTSSAWPASLPTPGAANRSAFEAELRNLEISRAAAPRVRRLLANCATYMTFDDHEVSDDWNLDAAWRRNTDNPTGRRIMANALTAFWAFQGWGNDPDAWDDAWGRCIEAYATARDADTNAAPLEAMVLGRQRWTFVAPTTPATLFLDTRTSRTGSTRHPILIDQQGWAVARDRLRAVSSPRPRELAIVAPAPVFFIKPLEVYQALSTIVQGPYPEDAEGWAANANSLGGFMQFIADENLAMVAVLSGDVHFGSFGKGYVRDYQPSGARQPRRSVAVAQFTSSALKNPPSGFQQTLLNFAGRAPGLALDGQRVEVLPGRPEWQFVGLIGRQVHRAFRLLPVLPIIQRTVPIFSARSLTSDVSLTRNRAVLPLPPIAIPVRSLFPTVVPVANAGSLRFGYNEAHHIFICGASGIHQVDYDLNRWTD